MDEGIGYAKPKLAQDDAVRFELLAGVLSFVQHRFEAVVVGFQHQLLRHEADRGAFHAFDVLDGVLHLRGAVCAVEILEFECLSHGGVLSFRRCCERGRAGAESKHPVPRSMRGLFADMGHALGEHRVQRGRPTASR